MQDFLVTTGMILNMTPIGDYDRRIVILTKETGKITAFVKGARRPNSPFVAATNPFSFGVFKLYVGRTSYNLVEFTVNNYFEELRKSFEEAYYGMYFLEIMDYMTRENNDEKEMLKLLYQSLKALTAKSIPKELVRYIFEMKVLVINGEFPGVPTNRKILESTIYTIEYIMNTSIEKLYTFKVSEEVLKELRKIAKEYGTSYYDKKFKCLDMIENL